MIGNYENYSTEKRLHPLTLVYRGFTNLPSILLPLYLIFIRESTEEWFFLILSFFLLFTTIPFIILNYFYYSFYITTSEIVIKSGVLSRKQRNIPIRRIQNINIEQNFIQRILGIARVQIETAGDASTEGILEFVSRSDAEEIKEILQSYKDEKVESTEISQSEDNTESVISDEENVIFSMSLFDNVRHGMLRFRPVAVAIGFWIFTFGQQFLIFPSIEELEIDVFVDDLINHASVYILVLYGFALLFGIFLTSWITDILLTINQFYKFNLTMLENKLQVKYGLLTKRLGSIPLKKLQSMSIITNPIAKMFDFYRLNIQTAGFGANMGTPEVAVPFAKYEDLKVIIGKVKKIVIPEELNHVSQKTIRRGFIRNFMLLSFFIVPLAFWKIEFLWAYTSIPLLLLHAYYRWKFRGYLLLENILVIKQGIWVRRMTIIPIEKLQTIHTRSSFFQRRLKLASVIIDTAASSLSADAKIIDIDVEDSEKIMIDISESFHKLRFG